MPTKISRKFVASISIIAIFVLAIFLCACKTDNTFVRVGSLNGPTSIGLQEMPKEGYEFNNVTQPDALVSQIASEDIDIALLPANVAVTLYNKTNGGVKVIDINAKNVLKLICQNESINDVKGKTLYSAGKGTVVEANIIIWLNSMGLNESDINHQFKSDANEVVASLLQDPNALGVVNEPIASNALKKYSNLHLNENFNGAIKKAYGENAAPITGVTIVRTKFLEEHKDLVDKFLKDHKASVTKSLETNEEARNCDVDFISGNEMKAKLQASMKLVYEINPKLFGNKEADDNFYYINE